MKALFFFLIPTLLFADQIFTFDRYLPDSVTTSGDIQYTDDAMGAALLLEDRSHVAIHDIVLPDSFTMVFWMKEYESPNRVIIEMNNAAIWFSGTQKLSFRSGGARAGSKYFTSELISDKVYGKLEGAWTLKAWYPIVWTKRIYKGSFGAVHQIDSVWACNYLAFATHVTGSDTWGRDTTNITIGRADVDQTPSRLRFDHLCIFDEVATSDQLSDIWSLYELDGPVKVAQRPMVRKMTVMKDAGHGVYSVMGRRVDSQKPSTHWLIKTDQLMK